VNASATPQPKKISPIWWRGHVERERRERQQREEAKVVQQCGDCDAEQALVAQSAERVGQRAGMPGARCGWQ
jgi:hypothetical protein